MANAKWASGGAVQHWRSAECRSAEQAIGVEEVGVGFVAGTKRSSLQVPEGVLIKDLATEL